jgi:simple sugar transport system ATP-binding protein
MQNTFDPQESVPAVELQGVSKRYGNGVLANDDVSFVVQHGEVHAVLGENGAGKSTVMKMLYGQERPSEGSIRIAGVAVDFRHPRDAIAAGVGLVPQHLELVESFSVAQNVVLGQEPGQGFWVDHRAAEEQVAEVAQRFGLAVNPKAIVSQLSVGERQRVEILKTLYRSAKILLLDEPTALLTPQESDALFKALRKLATEGFTVLLITHKPAEVRQVADRFTVLRSGKVVGRGVAAGMNDTEIARMIVGNSISQPSVRRARHHRAVPLVSLRDLSLQAPDGHRQLEGIHLDIAAGEILGIAGVEGNGQAQLADVLSGLVCATRGSASLAGKPIPVGDARAVRKLGVGQIPEDRLHNGVAPDMSLSENVAAAVYHRPPLSQRGWLRVAAARAMAKRAIKDYAVVSSSEDAPMRSLSGGNMQKLVLARELAEQPSFLVASQPTRGVDIGAAQFLRQQLVDLRDKGSAILLLSADLDEVMALADRIAVLHAGRIVGHFDADSVEPRELGLYMTGLRVQQNATARLDAPFVEHTQETTP